MIKNRAKIEILDDLRQRIAHLERPILDRDNVLEPLTFGIAEIDQRLPQGGLAPAALHEIASISPDTVVPALGFAAALLGRAARRAPVLWCRSGETWGEELHAPGLESFGLGPANLIVVDAAKDWELLWAMEEALRSGALAAVLGEIHTLSIISARRLQLAAETGVTLAFLLCGQPDARASTMAMTRWEIGAAASNHPLGPWPGLARWRVALQRCRGGSGGNWLVEWQDANNDESETSGETGGFHLATSLRDRPLRAAKSVASNSLAAAPTWLPAGKVG